MLGTLTPQELPVRIREDIVPYYLSYQVIRGGEKTGQKEKSWCCGLPEGELSVVTRGAMARASLVDLLVEEDVPADLIVLLVFK